MFQLYHFKLLFHAFPESFQQFKHANVVFKHGFARKMDESAGVIPGRINPFSTITGFRFLSFIETKLIPLLTLSGAVVGL